MSFLQNREVYFNQESLPITYHNFHQKRTWISTHELQGEFFTERKHAPNICQIQYDLPQ